MIIAIAIVSVILSFISLKHLNDKSHVNHTKKRLEKGRVIFQDTSSSSGE